MTNDNRNPNDNTRNLSVVIRHFLRFALGLSEARDAVPFFPLTALLEQFDAFKTLQDVAFAAQGRRRSQTSML